MTDAAAPPAEPSASATAPPETMAWDSRARRMVVLWLPLAFQRAIPGGQLGEGAAIATAMIPFLIAATLSS